MCTENSIKCSPYLLSILHMGSWTIASIGRFIPSGPSPFHNTLRHLILIVTVIIPFPVSSNMSSTVSALTFSTASISTLRRSPPLNFIQKASEKKIFKKWQFELKEILDHEAFKDHYLIKVPFLQRNFLKFIMSPFPVIFGFPQSPSTLYPPLESGEKSNTFYDQV